MLAKAMREQPSAESAQSRSFVLLDGASDGLCSRHRRSQSETSSLGAIEGLASMGESTQITRMPLNGMMTISVPSTSVRISAHPTYGHLTFGRFTLSNARDPVHHMAGQTNAPGAPGP